MTTPALFVLFFLSGISGLVYQVVWVRAFGNVFGNTIYSASLVVATFMLGLGAGSYLIGVRADRRYAHAPDSLLRVYGFIELAIAAQGLLISLLLPRLGVLAAAISSYVADESGWFVLSAASYGARAALVLVLLAPITVLMGGTLTLLVRQLVRSDVTTRGGWTIALLYAVNTAGAATGAFLTDFALVPAIGLLGTQVIAVALNAVAGVGAFALSGVKAGARGGLRAEVRTAVGGGGPARVGGRVSAQVAWAAVALVLTGFAAMGLEILWLRHFTLLLGGFRGIFSLLLTMVLVGIGAGALLGGALHRRTRAPAPLFVLTQAVLVIATLLGLRATSATDITNTSTASELWFNLRPMLFEAGLPALLMGCSFPLANAIIQRAEEVVGRRAGALYLANTAGAVAGSLITGFLLLPAAGMQGTATVLTVIAAASIAPIHLASTDRMHRLTIATAGAALASAAAIALWLTLPSDFVLRRALLPQVEGQQLLTIREAVGEVIAVADAPGTGRGLLTNGHAMSSTAPLDQRYMRALAHVPLLAMERPAHVLVIGFGVGNTTQAATLHPSVDRVDVADLSRDILEHAEYFRDVNHAVLSHPRVSVFVNDGRLHLQMQPESTYDLITLEPPPIAHAGVASLYSRDFYQLARTRLRPGGYLTQWLPAYQVPAGTALAMVRAFVDVFPEAVLLSGAREELILMGTTATAIAIDPAALRAALEHAPDARADLRRLDLGTPTEIVGTFVGSAKTLARATRDARPATDDRPLQEYAVRSVLGSARLGIPAVLFDVAAVADWCPACIRDDAPTPEVAGLDTYLALLDHAYRTPANPRVRPRPGQQILGSAYLGAVVPETAATQAILADAHYERGRELLERGAFDDAAREFRAVLAALPDSAAAHNNLGVALASMGRVDQAAEHFRQALAIEPNFEEARNNLARAGSR
jgi:spermidine synthase